MISRKRSWNVTFHNKTTNGQHDTRNRETFDPEQSTTTNLRPSLKLQPDQHAPVMIHHGCLLLPFCFTAWWYWTRKATKRVARRVAPVLCRGIDPADTGCFGDDYYSSCEEPSLEVISDDNDSVDPFHSWQDVVRFKSSDPSVRRVRWFQSWKNPRSPKWSSKKRRNRSYTNKDAWEEGMISSTARSTNDRRHNVEIILWNDIEGIELWEIPKR